MNVLWIAFLALLVLLEKVTPFGRRGARRRRCLYRRGCLDFVVFTAVTNLASLAEVFGGRADVICWPQEFRLETQARTSDAGNPAELKC
jgi:hypothetical protein